MCLSSMQLGRASVFVSLGVEFSLLQEYGTHAVSGCIGGKEEGFGVVWLSEYGLGTH